MRTGFEAVDADGHVHAEEALFTEYLESGLPRKNAGLSPERGSEPPFRRGRQGTSAFPGRDFGSQADVVERPGQSP